MEGTMKSAFVTGATGAIGMALIEELLRQNMAVTVMVRPDSGRKSRLERFRGEPRFCVCECPLDRMKNLKTGETGRYDLFFHLAWEGTIGPGRDEPMLQLKNIQYTLDAVHLAKELGCHAFVGAGSQAEYGRVEKKIRPDTPAFPETGYGMAKLCAGQLSRLECRRLGIRHEWARILSVYGPYDGERTMVISSIRKLLRGECAEFSAAEQQWDYLYSGDAARAFALIGTHGRDGAVYPVGSGKSRRLSEYIAVMQKEVGDDADVRIGALPYRENQVMYLCADISDLVRDTGFCPVTPFEKGIADTVAWCRGTEAEKRISVHGK